MESVCNTASLKSLTVRLANDRSIALIERRERQRATVIERDDPRILTVLTAALLEPYFIVWNCQ